MQNVKEIHVHSRGPNWGALVYPVISRRAQGLSLGINLFPDKKTCTFDCPYCEVEEFRNRGEFSLDKLDEALRHFFSAVYPERWRNTPVKDISISGNGEPTASPDLERALELCAGAKRRFPAIAKTPIVLITNSTGFLSPATVAFLKEFYRAEGLKVWAKLDAGNASLFERMSGSLYPFNLVFASIEAFALEVPLILQTMLCSIAGSPPSEGDIRDYIDRITELLSGGAKIEALHLYTVARTPSNPAALAVPTAFISEVVEKIKSRIGGLALAQSPEVLGFDENGLLKTPKQW